MDADFGSLSMKMAGSLLLVLGLIISLFYILRRLRLGSLSLNRYPEMRILGTLNLAPKRAIALVEICDQWLIVGVGTENVTLLSRLDRPPQDNDVDTRPTGNVESFKSLLQNKRPWQRNKKTTNTRENA